jgi:antitoxin HicB
MTMPKRSPLLKEYLARPYHRVLRRTDDLYSCEVIELPGCFSSGETAAEAVDNLGEAMEIWLSSELAAGHEIPEPIDEDHYAGRVSLRLTPTLHRRATVAAAIEGVSLNRLLSTAIAVYLGELRPPSKHDNGRA